MSQYQIGDMIYLLLLLLMVGGVFIVSNRASLGKLAQQAIIWALIFIAAIAAVGLWDDIRHTVQPVQIVDNDSNQIILPRRPDGHYHLTAQVNGTPVEFVVDTGASQIVLSKEDALTVGIDVNNLAYIGTAQTANGSVRIAPIRLDAINIGEIADRNVPAVVNEGELFQSLLGMSYLQRFRQVEIRNNKLILSR